MIKELLKFLEENNIINDFYIEDVGNGISIEDSIDTLRGTNYNFDLANSTREFVENVIEDKIGEVIELNITEGYSSEYDREHDALQDYETIEYIVEYNDKSRQLI